MNFVPTAKNALIATIAQNALIVGLVKTVTAVAIVLNALAVPIATTAQDWLVAKACLCVAIARVVSTVMTVLD